MPKPETIHDVTERIEAAISTKRANPTSFTGRITLDIRDVERLIHAAIWGDD